MNYYQIQSNSSVHFQLLNCQIKPKGVIPQMKVSNEYILITVLRFLLNGVSIQFVFHIYVRLEGIEKLGYRTV